MEGPIPTGGSQEKKPQNDPQIEKLKNTTRTFFDKKRKAVSAWGVGEDGFSTEDAEANGKEAMNYYKRQTLKLLDTAEQINPSQKREYIEAMAVIAGQYGNAEYNNINGYDLYSEDMQTEIKKDDSTADALFMQASQKLFPEITAPSSALEAISTLKVLRNRNMYPSHKTALEVFASFSNDKEKLLKVIETEISNEARRLGDLLSENLLVGREPTKETQTELAEGEEYVYQLRLIRDSLQREELEKSQKNNRDKPQTEPVNETTRPSVNTQNADGHNAEAAARERLNTAYDAVEVKAKESQYTSVDTENLSNPDRLQFNFMLSRFGRDLGNIKGYANMAQAFESLYGDKAKPTPEQWKNAAEKITELMNEYRKDKRLNSDKAEEWLEKIKVLSKSL